MSKLPETLNNRLIVLSAIAVIYAGFQLSKSESIVWRFILGLFGYLLLAGLWQAWASRRK